jgi:GNAT superfamily N-acetyltransferase
MMRDDMPEVFHVFSRYGIPKSLEYLERCWRENQSGDRVTWVAFHDGAFAGSVHLLKTSHYPGFAEQGIPEISDFNVIPPLRRRGVGSALTDAAEKHALTIYGRVGLGVGLFANYGSAPRMYAKRSYIPDGRGVMYRQRPVEPGTEVVVDHDLNLYLIKER